MKKLAFAALFLGLVACGGKDPVHLTDAGGSGSDGGDVPTCNVLTQMGCAAGQKCTWITDSDMPDLGHIGCVQDGTVDVGGACTVGAPGPTTGFDDCKAGSMCVHKICKTICDENGGTPMCDAQHSCQVYSGLFGPQGSEAAGVCDSLCNPLDDNDFDGSGSATKTGTACAADEGCYGFFSGTHATRFSCAAFLDTNTNLVHRSACTPANNCAISINGQDVGYANGCAPGYYPLVKDDTTGMNEELCRAYCSPASCSTGNCGAGSDTNHVGASPHRCKNPDALGDFSNDASCMYGWSFQFDANNNYVPSDYGDTVGICLEHSDFHLGDANNQPTDTTWPACADMAPTFTGSGSDAPDCVGGSAYNVANCFGDEFGCVDSTTAGLGSGSAFNLRKRMRASHIVLPRPLYHEAMHL